MMESDAIQKKKVGREDGGGVRWCSGEDSYQRKKKQTVGKSS